MPAQVRPAGERLMIIVGGDALAVSTAREICGRPGHRVIVLWPGDDEFDRAIEAIGAGLVSGQPENRDSLERAGVHEAETILALSRDDQLNLHTALRARCQSRHPHRLAPVQPYPGGEDRAEPA